MRRLAQLLILLPLCVAPIRSATGHPMPNSAVVLRWLPSGVAVELTLPITELTLGWEQPLPEDAHRAVEQFGEALRGYVGAHIGGSAPDGRPWLISIHDVTAVVAAESALRVTLTMVPPPGAPGDRLIFRYDAIFHHLITHSAVVTLASDWRNGVTDEEPVLLGTMRDTEPTLAIDRSGGSWLRGFAAMFRLGARHITEGTDHLLFLLGLLLPAPLVAVSGRWGGYAGGRATTRRIVGIVTAFTGGHSITLLIGVLGWAHLPTAVVESAIALSILVAAAHALKPILGRREVWVAGGFGLVHGLAFAATLRNSGLDPWTLIVSVLGFNLGIEAFQLLVVVVTIPWLVLLARSPWYAPVRILGAILTGIAASAWFAERAFGQTNPVAPVVGSVAAHPLWLLGGLAGVALIATITRRGRIAPVPPAEARFDRV